MALAEEHTFPPHPTQLLHELPKFVCVANLSLHQATRPSTKHFCHALIRYGFQMGQARPHLDLTDADLFPAVSVTWLRKAIVDDALCNLRA
jgi:hypothetical protein